MKSKKEKLQQKQTECTKNVIRAAIFEVLNIVSHNNHKEILELMYRSGCENIGTRGLSPKHSIRLCIILGFYVRSLIFDYVMKHCNYVQIGMDGQQFNNKVAIMSVWIRILVNGKIATLSIGETKVEGKKGVNAFDILKRLLRHRI